MGKNKIMNLQTKGSAQNRLLAYAVGAAGVTVASAVPEGGNSLALLSLGALGILALHRKKLAV